MKLKDLFYALSDLYQTGHGDALVFMASDGEGNDFNRLADIEFRSFDGSDDPDDDEWGWDTDVFPSESILVIWPV